MMKENLSLGQQFGTIEKPDKVLVALSGGVDSSMTVQLLREQGFEVSAVVLRLSNCHEKAVDAAKKVAEQLQVDLTVADYADLFEKEIIEPFCNSYSN